MRRRQLGSAVHAAPQYATTSPTALSFESTANASVKALHQPYAERPRFSQSTNSSRVSELSAVTRLSLVTDTARKSNAGRADTSRPAAIQRIGCLGSNVRASSTVVHTVTTAQISETSSMTRAASSAPDGMPSKGLWKKAFWLRPNRGSLKCGLEIAI